MRAHGLRQHFYVETGEDEQGDFRADTVDADELAEPAALFQGVKAVEVMAVVAHCVMDKQRRFLPLMHALQHGKRHGDFIADAAGFDDDLSGLFEQDRAAQVSDHGVIR